MLAAPQVLDITLTDEQRNRPETTADGAPDPHRAGRVLKLLLSDGSQRVAALEYQRITSLSAQTPVGTKLLVSNITVRRGLLLLTPASVFLIGGGTSIGNPNPSGPAGPTPAAAGASPAFAASATQPSQPAQFGGAQPAQPAYASGANCKCPAEAPAFATPDAGGPRALAGPQGAARPGPPGPPVQWPHAPPAAGCSADSVTRLCASSAPHACGGTVASCSEPSGSTAAPPPGHNPAQPCARGGDAAGSACRGQGARASSSLADARPVPPPVSAGGAAHAPFPPTGAPRLGPPIQVEGHAHRGSRGLVDVDAHLFGEADSPTSPLLVRQHPQSRSPLQPHPLPQQSWLHRADLDRRAQNENLEPSAGWAVRGAPSKPVLPEACPTPPFNPCRAPPPVLQQQLPKARCHQRLELHSPQGEQQMEHPGGSPALQHVADATAPATPPAAGGVSSPVAVVSLRELVARHASGAPLPTSGVYVHAHGTRVLKFEVNADFRVELGLADDTGFEHSVSVCSALLRSMIRMSAPEWLAFFTSAETHRRGKKMAKATQKRLQAVMGMLRLGDRGGQLTLLGLPPEEHALG